MCLDKLNQSCLDSSNQPSTFENFTKTIFFEQGNKIAVELQKLNQRLCTNINLHRSQKKASATQKRLQNELKTAKVEIDQIKEQNTMLTEETICLSKNFAANFRKRFRRKSLRFRSPKGNGPDSRASGRFKSIRFKPN